jgi:hypothetical protein
VNPVTRLTHRAGSFVGSFVCTYLVFGIEVFSLKKWILQTLVLTSLHLLLLFDTRSTGYQVLVPGPCSQSFDLDRTSTGESCM